MKLIAHLGISRRNAVPEEDASSQPLVKEPESKNIIEKKSQVLSFGEDLGEAGGDDI